MGFSGLGCGVIRAFKSFQLQMRQMFWIRVSWDSDTARSDGFSVSYIYLLVLTADYFRPLHENLVFLINGRNLVFYCLCMLLVKRP